MLRKVSELKGIALFHARSFPDARGFLLQSYVSSHLASLGIETPFRQAIQSTSKRGVVRGLHFQWAPPQGKLVRCVSGRIFDVVVDVRHGSPTLGDHAVAELSGGNNAVLWIPAGFAHGFMALEEDATVLYECTSEWAPEGEGGIRWDDLSLGIDWPPIPTILSQKDLRLPTLEQWLRDPRSRNFRMAPAETGSAV